MRARANVEQHSNYFPLDLPDPQRLGGANRPGPDKRVDVANPQFLAARSSSRRFRQAFDYTQFIFKKTLGWGGFGVALKYEQVDANQQHVAYAAVKVPRTGAANITEAFEDEMKYYLVGYTEGLIDSFGMRTYDFAEIRSLRTHPTSAAIPPGPDGGAG